MHPEDESSESILNLMNRHAVDNANSAAAMADLLEELEREVKALRQIAADHADLTHHLRAIINIVVDPHQTIR